MARPGQSTLSSVSLRRLFPRASFVGCADVVVTDATERGSEAGPNMMFAAVPGSRVDGTAYVSEAIQRGANSLLVQQPLPDVEVPQCVVPNVRKAFAELCAALHGDPSRRMSVAGVTGTNGKTTTTWLIRSILQSAGHRTGLLGTIENSDGTTRSPATLTTPDARSLARLMARMRTNGATHATLELSSHALDQDRAAGVQLDVAIVTNITQDHFDYHGSWDNYRASKARIVERMKSGGIVALNTDDPGSASVAAQLAPGSRLLTFGLEQPADLRAEILDQSLDGTRFLLRTRDQMHPVRTGLIGRHNVLNCLAAAAAAMHFGLSFAEIARGIESLDAVPGRLERIDLGQDFNVFVDYAHTDDALRRCIRFLKPLTEGRVIVVFGAGGDRDPSKRPLMGKAAAEADLVVVTSDNPRTENPETIIDQIVAGFSGTSKQPFIHVDRTAAIRWALQHASTGDCVLIAGKGHETEQIIGVERLPFDDRQVARELLAELVSSPARRRVRLTA